MARLLVAVTGRVPPLSDLTAGSALEVSQIRSIRPFVLGGAVATFVSMGLAILPMARRSVLDLRSLSARPTRSSVWQRYNLDLFAIALSLVILVQLAQRGFINLSDDGATLDPLAIGFPALLLFTGALVLLRIFPWVLRAVGWAMTKSRSMALSLPGWHLGRNPIPYGRLALLVWLTTGLGAFALTYANTLDQSFDDRGCVRRRRRPSSDLRRMSATWTCPMGMSAHPCCGRSAARAAVPARRRCSRCDPRNSPQSPSGAVTSVGTPDAVFGALRLDGRAPVAGVAIPADATALRFDGIVIPRSLFLEDRLGETATSQALRLMLKVFDARGRVWTMAADSDLLDTEWTVVEVDLSTGLNGDYTSPPEPPLAVHAMWFERSDQTSGNTLDGESVLATEIAVVTPGGVVPIDLLSDLVPEGGLSVQRDVPASFARDVRYSQLPPDAPEPTVDELADSPFTRAGTATRFSIEGSRRPVSPDVPALRMRPEPVAVLLDAEAAAIAGLSVGESASFVVEGTIVDGVFRGFVGDVPTMSDGTKEGNMVVDFDGVNVWLNGEVSWSLRGNLARVVAPNELWIATGDTDAALQFVSSQIGEDPETFDHDRSIGRRLLEPTDSGGSGVDPVRRHRHEGGARARRGHRIRAGGGVAPRPGDGGAAGPRVPVAAAWRRRSPSSSWWCSASEPSSVCLGGIALMRTMIPFLQLGETAEDIEPVDRACGRWRVLLASTSASWPAAGDRVGAVGTRRVSARRLSEVLREVER